MKKTTRSENGKATTRDELTDAVLESFLEETKARLRAGDAKALAKLQQVAERDGSRLVAAAAPQRRKDAAARCMRSLL